jgi:hypothetical protein
VATSFDETYLPRDIGEKVAGNDLEVEPVFSLLENKYDKGVTIGKLVARHSSTCALLLPHGSR